MGFIDKLAALVASLAVTVLVANAYGHLIADKINILIATAFH